MEIKIEKMAHLLKTLKAAHLVWKLLLLAGLVLAVYLYIKNVHWQELERRLNGYYDRGEYEQALRVAEEQLDTTNQIYYFGKFYISATLNNFGRIYYSKEDFPSAERYYLGALKKAESVFGVNNRKLSVILENLAKLYRAWGREAQAALFVERLGRLKAKSAP